MFKATTFTVLIFFFHSFFTQSQGFVNDPVIGTQEIAVVPFDYLQDGNEQSLTVIDDGFFSNAFSVKNFIEEISYGKASLNGIVYPYRTNQPPLYGSGYTNCYPLDQDIVNQPDVDYTIIDGIVLMVHSNTTGCGAGVSSFEKLPFTTIDGPFDFRRSGFRTEFYFPHDFSKVTSSTVAHEILHSFGIPYHSNSYIKNNGEWTLQGYGNLFDIMGLRSQTSHPCSLIKQQKGWLTDNEIENVSTTDTFRIYALEQTLPGQTQSIVVDLPNDLDIQPNDPTVFSKLYLEYRGLTGFDARTNRNVPLSDGSMHSIQDPHGLLILGADCQTNADYCVPVLIDTHPDPLGGIGANYGPHEASDAQLNLNETYFVGNNSISIKVVNVEEGEYIDVFIDFSALAVDGNSKLNNLKVYPNPASNQVTITNSGNTLLHKISFYDLAGREVKTLSREVLGDSLSAISIDVSDLKKGTYLVKIDDKKQSITRRLVISK
jgi:hypothetical protein